MATLMASDDITALIDAITAGRSVAVESRRSPPPVATSPVKGRQRGVRGSVAIGFGVTLALVGMVAAGLRDAAPVAVDTPVVSAAPVAPVVLAAPAPPPPARAVDPVRRVTARRVARVVVPRKPKLRLAAAKPAVVAPRVARSDPSTQRAVHLTGAALQVALAEDRVKTRVLNQRQLERLGSD